MKLTILKEKLEEGVEICSRITTKKASLPILENLLLEAEKNFLKIYATNLESALLWWSLAKVEKEGKVCVSSNFLKSLISSIKEDVVELKSENSNLILETKEINAKLKTINPEEFPIFPEKNTLESFLINSEILIDSLSKIINIPSPSLGRPEIGGILFSFEKEILKLVATDSFRLTEITLKHNLSLEKSFSFILPQKEAKEFINIFRKEKGEIKIYISPNQVFFEKYMEETEHPKILFMARLIEGEFPNYQDIIPRKFNVEIKLEKEKFLQQIKTASCFAGRQNDIILKIFPSEKKIEIKSSNPDFGEIKTNILAEVKGNELEISFNYKFLVDGISSIEEKDFYFLLTSSEGPAVIRPSRTENYLYVVMPIALSSLS